MSPARALRDGQRHAVPAAADRHRDAADRRRGPDEDRGAVTAELALGLPAVVSVLLVVLVLSTVATAQLRCADGARAGARAAALGEDTAAVTATATRLAGPGATVGVRQDGDWVSVTVTRRVAVTSWGAAPWTVRAEASARVEP